MSQEFYTVAEFAQLLRVSESTVRNYIRKGYIKAIKFGVERRATVRIPKSEIEALYDINSPKQEEEE
jgi:excisionase family DNA binding protein|tara:strand:- start:268 stop:468 length:201 start_codon:yes stop_codon:yes gene_type:complete